MYHLSFIIYHLSFLLYLLCIINLTYQRVTIKDNQPNGYNKTFNGAGEGKEIANFELVCIIPLPSLSLLHFRRLYVFVCLFVYFYVAHLLFAAS